MSEPRRSWVVLGCLVLVASAGCLGFVTGSDALEFTANETVASDAALAETGYQLARNETVGDTVNVSVADQTSQANVTSHLFVYNRSVELDQAASNEGPETDGASTSDAVRVTVFTSPSASVGGRSVNPLAQFSTTELVKRFLSASDASGEFQFERNRTVRSLGDRRTVSTFRTGASDGRNGTDGLVHVTSFEAGPDFVVVVATHPASLDEAERIDTLLEGLERRPH